MMRQFYIAIGIIYSALTILSIGKLIYQACVWRLDFWTFIAFIIVLRFPWPIESRQARSPGNIWDML